MIGIELQLYLLLFYLFGVIGKEFAGHDALALDEDLSIDLLFDGELEIGGKQGEDVTFRREFYAVEDGIAALDGKRFCDF